MVPRPRIPWLAVLSLLALAACERSPNSQQAESSVPTSTGETQGTVTRTESLPPAEPAQPPQQAVIQTQPGPDGAQVALNKVRVTGDVMTVQLTYTGEDGVPYVILDDVSLIDDATAQRIGVLKDNDGKWLASPLGGSGDRLSINLFQSPAIVWMKFPAPPATSKTVSLNIPQVAPFDGVPVTR